MRMAVDQMVATDTVGQLRARINRRLRGLMAEREVTQQDVAERFGVSQAAISRRMHGSVDWTYVELAQLALFLGVPVTELLPHLDSNQEPAGYHRANLFGNSEFDYRMNDYGIFSSEILESALALSA